MNNKLHSKNFVLKFIFMLFILCFTINVAKADNIYDIMQQSEITINMQDKLVKDVLNEIQKQTNLNFVYNENELSSYSKKSLSVKNEKVDVALNKLFDGTNLTYKIVGNTITIVKKSEPKESVQVSPTFVLSGKVVAKMNKKPIVGATVIIGKTGNGAITDDAGEFKVKVQEGDEMEVSFTGMKPVTIKITASTSKNLVVEMLDDAVAVDDVIVTGIYSRKKESFTGSASVYTSKDLKMVGNMNVLQSLKTLDPSFAIIENNIYGSDPNRLPDIEVRGKTSVLGLTNEFKTDPNQPLFILDGFETSLQTISDLSMDRIENIVVLKDAAATAIYGSKAANGVIVVETKTPKPGKLSVNYNGNFALAFADLTDYNMMNAVEKLEFEKLSGFYGTLRPDGSIVNEGDASLYYQRQAEIARGVDSYWLNEPLRTAFSHTHNINIDGGDQAFRYGVGFTYGNKQGVMKGSDRETMNGNIKLIYRTGNVLVSNNLNLNYSFSGREKVTFNEFAQTNPFYRKTDADGNYLKVLEQYTAQDSGDDNLKTKYIYNPLYNASLGSSNNTSSFGFTNNTNVEWSILQELKVRGKFSITKTNGRGINFKSPNHTDFISVEKIRRGTYLRSDDNGLNFDGDFSVTYGKLIKDVHLVNAVIGMRASQNEAVSSGYSAEGFLDDTYSNPAFSTGYSQDDNKKKPSYSELINRSLSYYFNGGYVYDNRYMVDVNFRLDGSSVFGINRRFTQTWAVGLSWNVNKEKFFKDSDWLNTLKIRGSIGNPGNQNFDANIAQKTYRYNNTLQNPFGLSTIISGLGNPDLEWQKTLDKNIGLDFGILNRKLLLTVDIFNKNTNPLLVYIAVPTSVGTSQIASNVGAQITKGFTATVNYRVMGDGEDFSWNINANARRLRSQYQDIGNYLEKFNKDNKSKNLVRYYDGADPNALWAVRSAGIDPASGREVFIRKDGTQTYVFNYDDEVQVGSSNPKFEGVIGSSFYYKGFSASINFRYKLGGDVFLSALYDKVENISADGLKYNQDKRALYERWQKPGDDARFKAISLTSTTPMSSRFVSTENLFSCESISLGYETTAKALRKAGISSLSFKMYMSDIFRISTVKNERGIEYPFERSVSFSVGLRF